MAKAIDAFHGVHRFASQEELQERREELHHILDLAELGGIDFGTNYLDEVHGELAAIAVVESDREQRGYTIRFKYDGFDRHTVDEVKARLDLAQLVERAGYPVMKQGRAFKASCPFHRPDRSPSFTIYPDNHYYCFGCHVHGDVLDWIAFSNGLDVKKDFQDVMRRAADLANVVLPVVLKAGEI